jgi:hypothetical protein
MNSIIAALYGDPSKGTPVSPHSRPAYTPDYTSAYKPAPTSTKTVAEQEQEERDRKRAAVEEANTPKPLEERSRDVIAGLYGGGPGSRVLTQEEINTGYTNALGEYVPAQFQDTRSEEELAEMRARNLSRQWYRQGMDSFEGSTPVGYTSFADNPDVFGNHDIRNEALQHARRLLGTPDGQGSISPWISTFHGDRLNTYNYVRDADYNAFLGTHGGKQSDYDDYRDDSIAGWFKNAFAGDDQVKNRASAIKAVNSLDRGLSRSSDVMTKQYFDQLDLANKYGLTWEQAGAVANQNYNESGGSPVNPGNETVLPGNGMLSRQNSSWMDVLNRGGADNWDSLLGQYTYNSPLDWASMDNQTVQTQFSDLFDSGGMFTQGKNRDLIYAKLMENMGRV